MIPGGLGFNIMSSSLRQQSSSLFISLRGRKGVLGNLSHKQTEIQSKIKLDNTNLLSAKKQIICLFKGILFKKSVLTLTIIFHSGNLMSF